MNGNKKIILLSFVLLAAIFLTLSACKKNDNKAGGGETVVVTDQNGVPVTDENGEAITVVLETEIVEVTNANGDKVYDENGEVKTSVVYLPQNVGVPVTDENGVPVTDKNGHVVTTMITVPPSTGGPSVTAIPITDANGNPVIGPNGETLTYTETILTNPVTPGDNNANWGSTFGGSGSDKFVGTAPLSDGGFVALMQSNSKDGSLSSLAGNSETPIPVLIRYKKNGTVAWQKAITSNYGVIVTGLVTDKDDNIALCGYSKATDLGTTPAGEYDALLYKFNKNGDQIWLKSFSGSGVDGFEHLAVGADGALVAVGYTGSKDGDAAQLGRKNGESGSMVAKYTADGNLVFVKSVGTGQDSLSGVTVDKDGNIYAVGNFTAKEGGLFQIAGRSDGGVLKFSADGSLLWKQSFGGENIDNFYAVAPAVDGGCVVVGRSKSDNFNFPELVNQGGYDAIMIKYNADGSVGWRNAFRGFYDETFTDIVATKEGYVAVGYSNSSNRDLKPIGNRGGTDSFILTIDANGKTTSLQGYGGSKDDEFTSVCVTTQDKIIACGFTYSNDGDLVGAKYPNGKNDHSLGMIARFS